MERQERKEKLEDRIWRRGQSEIDEARETMTERRRQRDIHVHREKKTQR